MGTLKITLIKINRTMKTSSIPAFQVMTTILSVMSIVSPLTEAFQSSATATPPIVEPLNIPTIETINTIQHKGPSTAASKNIFLDKATSTTPPRRKQVQYDLGMGKNKPVVATKRAAAALPVANRQMTDPTRFMIDHESVRQFPSPNNGSGNKGNAQAKTRRVVDLPKVQHRRHSEDVLLIRDGDNNNYDDGTNARHPVIVPVNRNSAENGLQATKIEVNTVWVEMMLHNEREKLLQAN